MQASHQFINPENRFEAVHDVGDADGEAAAGGGEAEDEGGAADNAEDEAEEPSLLGMLEKDALF